MMTSLFRLDIVASSLLLGAHPSRERTGNSHFAVDEAKRQYSKGSRRRSTDDPCSIFRIKGGGMARTDKMLYLAIPSENVTTSMCTDGRIANNPLCCD